MFVSLNFKNRKRLFAATLLVTSLLGVTTEAAMALPASVKVSLFEAHPEITAVNVDGAFEIGPNGPSSKGHTEISLSKGSLYLKSGRGKAPRRVGGRLVIRPLSAAPLLLQPNGLAARHYRGSIVVTASGGKLKLVNEVDTKSYITSVVGSESAPEFPLEALKAQAVLASSVLARQRPGLKLNDSTEVQAYLGSDYERPLAKQAVGSVFGQILTTASGTTPAVFYHSTCAGGTSDEREIFSGKVLNDSARQPVSSCRTATRVKCSYCQASPFFKPHVVQFSAAELRKKVGYVPVAVEVKDPQGRPLSVSVAKENMGTASSSSSSSSKTSISGYDLWLKLGQGLGWGAVPGMRYSFESKDDPSGPIVTFTSTGAGHGAGLCQWGAAGMARAGKSYREILHYYFPLADVNRK
ncbi:MAG: SpoIID/LytB domain-containing protein [Candidatus Obscuribacterales bacterium]|jgi:stage II sporulation protein D